jgi:A/G-specific adenine glycosylase
VPPMRRTRDRDQYMKIAPASKGRFRKQLADWARNNLRRYPWRAARYGRFKGLVTEVLLARTRADAVAVAIGPLFTRYPDAASLADARESELQTYLRPLGLFRKRALLLKRLAAAVNASKGVPSTERELLSLPGVGRYAASAYRCFYLGERAAIVDANVARVIGRYFGVRQRAERMATDERLWRFAMSLLPAANVRHFAWALLDFGGTICLPQRPRCVDCPVRRGCYFHLRSLQQP